MKTKALDERNAAFYTERGLEALNHRMRSLQEIFNDGEFPAKGMMLGFGSFNIWDKRELIARLTELGSITGQQFKLIDAITKNTDGTSQIKQTIEFYEEAI